MLLGVHDGFKFNISLVLPVFPFSRNLYELNLVGSWLGEFNSNSNSIQIKNC